MGHLKLRCDACGTDWVVYHRDDWKDWRARTCPACGKSIDPGTWERQVLRGFNEMEDANIELVKDHMQSHGTLFTVGYVPDVMFPNREKALEAVEQLREDVDSLRNTVSKLIDGVFSFDV